MPKYRATLAENIRAYREMEFEAPSDIAAKTHAINGIDWGDIEPSNYDSADHEERSIMLDDITNITSEDPRVVDDEIAIPGDEPSYDDLAEFVKRVAALAEEGSYSSPVDTLDSLINDARLALGEID